MSNFALACWVGGLWILVRIAIQFAFHPSQRFSGTMSIRETIELPFYYVNSMILFWGFGVMAFTDWHDGCGVGLLEGLTVMLALWGLLSGARVPRHSNAPLVKLREDPSRGEP